MELAIEADQLEQNLGERAQEHLHATESLQKFFEQARGQVADRAVRSSAGQLVAPYGTRILEFIDTMAGEAKQSQIENMDAETVEVTNQIRERRMELRTVLSNYLLADPLPTLDWALSLNLGGTAPHGQILLNHPGELSTNFVIDVSGDSAWGRPRKIGEISPALTLQVGFKKAFLRSSVHPDIQTLDDFYVGELEIGPQSMELHLRRKPDSGRTSFVIDYEFGEHGPRVKVSRRDEKGDGGEPLYSPQGEDLQRIRQLVSAVRNECRPLLQRKSRLLSAHLDDRDVFEEGLVRQVYERIAARLKPIAEQVNRHSPSPLELSLKIEAADGRREEVYLRKQELVEMIESLPPDAKALFRGLGFLPENPSVPPAVPPAARK